MFKHISKYLLLGFIIASFTSVLAQNYDEELKLEERYEHLVNLEGDEYKEVRENTSRLKNMFGLWRNPAKKMTKLLNKHRSFIIEVAEIYEIPAEAIVGVMLAEHTLNYNIDDKIQNYLANEMGVDEADKLSMKAIGRGGSYGFAQVTVNMSGFSDKVMNRVEPDLEFDYRKQLLTLKGSIRIIAAIMRGEQDVYAEYDFDISDSPGILGTIFNLGQGFKRAKAAQDEGRSPKHNYMGMFIVKHIEHIKELLYY